jgi:hypothetical protein
MLEKQDSASKLSLRRIFYTTTSLLILIGLISSLWYIQGSTSSSFGLQTSSPITSWQHCGNSSQEALNNNCVLDIISGAWVPIACYDQDLEQEFLQLKDWKWYEDSAGEREISLDMIKKTGGPNPIHVSLDYHWTHCSFTWRKLHRAMKLKRPIDTHIGAYEHTVHCSMGLASRSDSTELKPVSGFYQHFETCEV